MELSKKNAEVEVRFAEEVQHCTQLHELVTLKEELVDGSSVQGHDEPDLSEQSCDDYEGHVCNLILRGGQKTSSENSIACNSVESDVPKLESISDDGNTGMSIVHNGKCSVKREPDYVAMFEGNQLSGTQSPVAESCPICHKVFQTKKYLPKHMKRCGGVVDKSVSCPMCNKVLTANYLHVHMKRHECPVVQRQSLPVACPICNKVIKAKGYLKTHMMLHTEERMYRCALCPKVFVTERRLTYHRKSTHEQKEPLVHKCNYCPRRFSNVSQLEAHTKEHEAGRYQCSVCNKHLSSNKSLNVHLRTHTGEKPYSCLICHVAFRQMSHLKTHEITHTGQKPYKCSLCNMNFGVKSALSRHLKIHAGVKPHSCPDCDRSFLALSTLKSHMLRKHSNVKHFNCSLCSRTFCCKADLLSHQKIHNANNPYKCAICGRPFSRRASFVRHINTHSRSKPFGCHLCAATFRLSGQLKKHIKIAHDADQSVASLIIERPESNN